MTSGRLSFAKAAEMLQVHKETVRVWARKGILLASGARVVLCSERVGGRSFTSAEWIEQFQVECNPGMESVISSRRTSNAELARQRLIQRGVYGSKKRGQLPRTRMQAQSRRSGIVPQVLPASALSGAQAPNHRGRISRQQRDARTAHRANVAGSVAANQGVAVQA